jgi:hypothetical protein
MNQKSNKGTENHCEYLIDIANNYNDNEKHYDEYESVSDATVNKVKAETKVVIINSKMLTQI